MKLGTFVKFVLKGLPATIPITCKQLQAPAACMHPPLDLRCTQIYNYQQLQVLLQLSERTRSLLLTTASCSHHHLIQLAGMLTERSWSYGQNPKSRIVGGSKVPTGTCHESDVHCLIDIRLMTHCYCTFSYI